MYKLDSKEINMTTEKIIDAIQHLVFMRKSNLNCKLDVNRIILKSYLKDILKEI